MKSRLITAATLCVPLMAYAQGPAPAASAPSARTLISTTVVADVHVDETGRATDAALEHSSGSKDVDERALKAARNWQFKPPVKDGKPTTAVARVPITVQSYADGKGAQGTP